MGEKKMDEIIELEKLRLKRKHQVNTYNPPKKKQLSSTSSKVVTRVLVSVIFILISTIYINWSDITKENFKQAVFGTNLSFTTINNWYEKQFGKVLPLDFPSIDTPVNNITNEVGEIKKYQDGVMAKVGKESIVNALNSGIVVFLGEKENYGNVVIVQGIDGVDIWYGNITNVDISLYDYVEKNSLLGSASDDYIYFVIQKDGNYLDYEEYKNQI